MANNEGFSTDDTETEDDDEESDTKTTKRTLRHVPFSIAKVKLETEKAESKRKLTLTGMLFERSDTKKDAEKLAKKQKKVDDEKEKIEKEVDEKVEEVSGPPGTETEEEEIDSLVEELVIIPEKAVDDKEKPVSSANLPLAKDKPSNAVKPIVEVAPDDKSKADLEAANWEPEGELSDEDEINLSIELPATNKKAVSQEYENEPAILEIPHPLIDIEQSSPTETEPVAPDLLASGLGSEGPPEPPETGIPLEQDEPDEPIPVSTVTGGGGPAGSNPRGWYNAATQPNRATQAELDDAEWQGRREGTRKGVVTGLLFGWLLGRHGKNKASREHSKELKNIDKEMKGLKEEQKASDMRLEALKTTHGQAWLNIEQSTAEAVAGAEKGLKMEIKKLSEQKLAPEDKPITEDTYKTFEGKRVETSAWHRMEVDAKTGKIVNNPKVEYGEEFKREQRQEIKDNDDNAKHGGTTDATSQLGSLATSTIDFLKESNINPLPQGLSSQSSSSPAKINDHSQIELTAGAELLRYASMPIIWVAAVLIVIVLFAFGLLH